MKQLFTFCLFSLLAFPTLSQSRFSLGVKMDAGLAGVTGKKSVKFRGDGEIRTTYRPGLSASIGLISEYYLDEHKRFGLGVGLLSNFSAYTRQDRQKFRGFNTQQIFSERKTDITFSLVSFQAPVKLLYRHKKFTFSLGLVNSWLGFVEMKRQSRSRWLDPPGEWVESPVVTISNSIFGEPEMSESNFVVLETSLERRYMPQILYGVAYKIKNNLSLGLEFTNYLRANHINHTTLDIDAISVGKDEFKHNALTMSLIWWTERK